MFCAETPFQHYSVTFRCKLNRALRESLLANNSIHCSVPLKVCFNHSAEPHYDIIRLCNRMIIFFTDIISFTGPEDYMAFSMKNRHDIYCTEIVLNKMIWMSFSFVIGPTQASHIFCYTVPKAWVTLSLTFSMLLWQ